MIIWKGELGLIIKEGIVKKVWNIFNFANFFGCKEIVLKKKMSKSEPLRF